MADVAGHQTRGAAFCRDGPELRPTLLRRQFVDEAVTVHVVDIDHRCAQPRPAKQGGLGLPVSVHVAVVIEVVLREIGEYGDRDARAVQALLGDTDRRGLDNTGAVTLIGKVAQFALPHHGVRRGQAGVRQVGRNTDAQRTHHAARPLHRFGRFRQGLRQPPGGRCLAIGAGDGQHVELIRRPAVERGCNRAGDRLEAIEAGNGFGIAKIESLDTLLLHQARHRAARQRRCDMLATIRRCTRPCNETIAWVHMPAVSMQRLHAPRLEPERSIPRGEQGLGASH